MDQVFDVIVAGGGMSGVLAAAKLAIAKPELRILLVEKEARLGGRLRATVTGEQRFGYGLNAVSDKLYNLLDQTLRHEDGTGPGAESAGQELAALVPRRQSRFGVLAGNKVAENDISLWFSPKGARTLGGLNAARQWPAVEEICRQGAAVAADDHDDDESGDDAGQQAAGEAKAGATAGRAHPFGHYWKQPRKVPAAVVLEHYGCAFGIPDVWAASPAALAARAAFHSGRLHCGPYEDAIAALAARDWFRRSVTVRTSARVGGAKYADGLWTVSTEAGEFKAASLVVAQPPWQAAFWMPRGEWPGHVLAIASKTKPVSVVVLAEQLRQPDAQLPDVILVPSERVQIVRNGADELCFQATIDYELSLQAPAVVKAVKALKRARRKLLQVYPDLVTETNHIALQPVAWAQSPTQADRRWIERLGRKSMDDRHLVFCGDAYGADYDGDGNLVASVVRAVDAILG